ncbi:prolyl 4-hydroxylase subunit alpha-3-like [Branchiostoma floridae x Branchiostoma belcheri]
MLVLVLLHSVLFTTVACASKQHGFSTAVVRLEKLLLFESKLVDEIRQHISDGDGVSEELKRYVVEYSILHPGSDDLAYHAHHPVGAYRLVKRLSHTDSSILKHAQLLTGLVQDEDEGLKTTELPTEEDLRMSALALIRLQDIYHLDMRSLTRGQLVMMSRQSDGTVVKQKTVTRGRAEPTFTLGAEDTVYIGDVAYAEEEYLNAVLWYLGTLDLMGRAGIVNDHTDDSGPGRVRVLMKLGDALTKLKQHQSALSFYRDALHLEPDNQLIKSHVSEEERQVTLHGNVTVKVAKVLKGSIPYQEEYEDLCHHSVLQNQPPSSRLRCAYVRTSPQLYLSPARLEELRERDPEIALYHDVISDEEAAMMRELAFRELKRSPVIDKHGKAFLSDFRVSETGWLHDNETELVSKLSRRVGYITGLNTDSPSAESFQVVNYGLGGLYVPHVDYFEEEQVKRIKKPGNRILTFLIYLSDVQEGGATVFPQIKLIVPAVKNAALMFRDMKRSGEFEPLSMHAGCPVLIGSKWIANKWILDRGNEFRRPCGLTPEE